VRNAAKTRSSGANSAEGGNPNGFIDAKRASDFFLEEFFNKIGETKPVHRLA
jgi:hypothetical protein